MSSVGEQREGITPSVLTLWADMFPAPVIRAAPSAKYVTRLGQTVPQRRRSTERSSRRCRRRRQPITLLPLPPRHPE